MWRRVGMAWEWKVRWIAVEIGNWRLRNGKNGVGYPGSGPGPFRALRLDSSVPVPNNRHSVPDLNLSFWIATLEAFSSLPSFVEFISPQTSSQAHSTARPASGHRGTGVPPACSPLLDPSPAGSPSNRPISFQAAAPDKKAAGAGSSLQPQPRLRSRSFRKPKI